MAMAMAVMDPLVVAMALKRVAAGVEEYSGCGLHTFLY